MSDELPTTPLPQPNADEPEARERRLTRTALIALSIIALLLLIGLTVVLTLLLSGRGDTPPTTPSTSPTAEPSASTSVEPSDEPSEEPSTEPSAEASAEPSEEPSETSAPPPPPPPPSNDPVITTFTAGSSTVACNTQSPQTFPAYISFTWAATKADRVYFGVDTNDAQAAPLFDNLPPSGTSQADFPAGYNDFQFGCPDASHKYTLTVVGSNGKKVHKTVTITNIGDTQ